MDKRAFEILSVENRIHRLSNSVKNLKCPGVLKKLRRRLRKLTEAQD